MKKLRPVLILLTVLCLAAGAGAEQAPVSVPGPDEYTRLDWGVTLFRGNACRQNAASGTVEPETERLTMLWEHAVPLEEGAARGNGWGEQPLIVKWPVEVRGLIRFDPGYEPYPAMKEVIIPGQDGTIRFLDLGDGRETRGPLKTGHSLISGLAMHPAGLPLLWVSETEENATGRIEQFNMYDLDLLDTFETTDGGYGFPSSALADRTTDTLLTAGADGRLYSAALNSSFDYKNGIIETDPEIRVSGGRTSMCLAPVSALGGDVWYADMEGKLRRVSSATMATVWEKDLEDAAVCAAALDVREDGTALYTGNVLTLREEGPVTVFRLDAESGEQAWRRDFGAEPDREDPMKEAGFLASPVIGQNRLDGLVFFTAAGLSAEACAELGLDADARSALIALDKETGKTAWAFGLAGYCYSSPVAVYDRYGAGKIIQCGADGQVMMLDGLDGTLTDSLRLKGSAASSPAVYRSYLVVETMDGGNAYIYGIRLETAEAGEPE